MDQKKKNVMTFKSYKRCHRDFPGGPVVKALHFIAGSIGLIISWGIKIPHSMWCSQKLINELNLKRSHG